MATPPLIVDKQAVFDTSLDGLLGGLHHLCKAQTQELGHSGIVKHHGTFWGRILQETKWK